MSVDLACILRWGRPVATGEVPFTMQQLVARYRETYVAAAKARLLEDRQPALIASLDEFFKWYEMMTPLKPLPPPLDAVPAQRVHQFTPETAILYNKACALEEDPTAAAGIAVGMEPSRSIPGYAPQDLPAQALNVGLYDQTTGRQQHAYIGRSEPITTGEYRLYPIGRTALSPRCLVWFDWSWGIQFPDLVSLYDSANPGKQWDIYASVRFEGPACDPQSTAERNRFYVDRVLLVEVEQETRGIADPCDAQRAKRTYLVRRQLLVTAPCAWRVSAYRCYSGDRWQASQATTVLCREASPAERTADR